MKQVRLCPWPAAPVASSLDRQAFRLFHHRALIETQLRLYLTHAYAHFTQLLSDAELRTWRWSSWLLANRDRLHSAASFNYDLLFEKALQPGISARYLIESLALFGLHPEVTLFKPHGSVNFEFAQSAIHYEGSNSSIYAAKNVFDLNDAPLRILSQSDLNRQRLNSDIVLPTEASRIRRFKYVAPGFRFLKLTRGDIGRCIIAGLSYWDCDRPEIDEILGNLGRNTEIIICNPKPPPELMVLCKERFNKVNVLLHDLPKT